MSIDPGVDDLLSGSGGPPAFKFDEVGKVAKGRVRAAQKSQATEYGTNKPETYPDGNPVMQVVITIEADDGEEFRLFAKGQMKGAIADALREAGASLEVGGELAVKFDHEEPTNFGSKKKVYVARYTAPAPASVSAADF
jgi:hypothetical protein